MGVIALDCLARLVLDPALDVALQPDDRLARRIAVDLYAAKQQREGAGSTGC
jgi:hypothetical protein